MFTEKTNEFDYEGEFNTQNEEYLANLKRPTILVCGYTGVGKTSIIQGILGKDLVSDDKITHGRPGTKDFLNYQNEYINLWDSQGFEPGQTEDEFLRATKDFVKKQQFDKNVDNHIHVVWYCIQGSGARVTPCDLELINNIFNKNHVLVILTKMDITRSQQKDGIINVLLNNGIQRKNIFTVSDQEDEGLKDVVKATSEMLDSAYKDAFEAAQIIDIDRKIASSNKIIHLAAGSAGAVGLIPLPMSDSLAITPIQIGMLVKLAHLWDCMNESVKASLYALAAQVAGITTATSLIKLIPGLGSLVQSSVAIGLTEALGHFMKNHFVKVYIAKRDNKPIPQLPAINEIIEIVKTYNRSR